MSQICRLCALLRSEVDLLSGCPATRTYTVAHLSVICAVLYSRAFKRFDDQRHYFRSLSIGASGLAYGLQVLWAAVLLWSELVTLTACRTLVTCCVAFNARLPQQRMHPHEPDQSAKVAQINHLWSGGGRLQAIGQVLAFCATQQSTSAVHVLGNFALQPASEATS